jgi:hypothetical protein
MSFKDLFDFESALAEFTGAPYAVVTDGCTHALELCMRFDKVTQTSFTANTYLSIPMLMQQLGIEYTHTEEQWIGEYQFHGTRIWDSARLLKQNMYREGQMQCLSFGNGKPLQLGKVGAILTDDVEIYDVISEMRSDGRDLRVSPWAEQLVFRQGYHYCPTLEDCKRGLELLPTAMQEPKYYQYPDLRKIIYK